MNLTICPVPVLADNPIAVLGTPDEAQESTKPIGPTKNRTLAAGQFNLSAWLNAKGT